MMRLPKLLQALVRLVRLQNAMMVLCAVLVSAYGASMCTSLHRAYHQALDDASATLESIARSSEVGTNRSIFAIDAALLGVERTLETLLPNTPLEDRRVKALLNQFDDETLVIRDILILDNRGRLLNKATWTAQADQDFSKEPFFTAHQGGGLPSLFIGAPVRSRATGGWSVMMSRPLLRRDEVIGVLVAEVPITVFSDFYNSVVANSGVMVKLLLDDGTLLATEPHQEELIGRRFDDAAAVLAAADKHRFGVLGNAADDTAAAYVVSFARIPARPLVLVASRSRGELLRQWRNEALSSAVAFILFAVTAGSLTWLMVRAVDRQQKAVGKLTASEERLQRQSDLLQSTLENMGEGLSVFDRHGLLVAWNARFVEMLDLPLDLTHETTLHDILAVQAERGDFGPVDSPGADVEQRLQRFFRDVPYVRERLTSQGRTLLIRRRSMPGGAVVSLYSDITERKAADVKMAQAWAQAELANRAKTDFLANMSHELRTPLNAIIGFSEILSGEHLGPLSNARYLEYATDIHASGLHLLSIINDVLDMSKIEAGKLDIHEEEVAIAPLVSSSLRMVRERARKQQVELVSTLVGPDHGVLADERALKQCLLNLLSNAVKFSPMGGTVRLEVAIDAEHRTIITITDEGIGMTEEEQERALQPFGQAHSATTRTYGGTGLGLPITQGLVEAHGGMMTITSCPGEGTRVSIALPADRTRIGTAAQVALRA
ncbi:MAG: PAS-domain containing protein [Alphaproteobacteria bacterium]|nr:PAS-domain containing protein [Alphaproteobacteria bacterium]MBV9554176.1 PAS-domain containing protein [Alphaproteobacteria bacterium]